MLSRMSIANFKAFGDEATFDLAPITLIYGENSAGKSSVIQAILSLAQSNEFVSGPQRWSGELMRLQTQGRRADLGTVRDVIFQRDLSTSISIGVAIENAPLAQRTAPDRDMLNSQLWRFSADSGTDRYLTQVESHLFYQKYSGIPFLSSTHQNVNGASMRRWHLNIEHPFVREKYESPQLTERIRDTIQYGNKILTIAQNYIDNYPDTSILKSDPQISAMINVVMWQGSRNKGGENYRPRMRVFRESIRRALTSLESYDIESFSSDSNEMINGASVRYRGTWLDQLHRLLDSNGVDTQQMRLVLLMLAMEASDGNWPINFDSISNEVKEFRHTIRRGLSRIQHVGPFRRRVERLTFNTADTSNEIESDGSNIAALLASKSELVVNVNKTLRKIGVPYELSIWEVDQEFSDALFSLQLTDTRTHTRVSMLDVGYGISQLIPIVVQLEYSRSTTVLIEQPELHLHPRQQADLGSLFLESYRIKGNQIITETHSEQIVLRTQRLIREGHLGNEDVCILYVTRNNAGSQVQRLRLDEEGDFIDPWPGGFFEDGLQELLGIGPLL